MRLPSGAWLQVAGVSSEAGGDLAVPSDIAVAGWWRSGSRVGDPFGSTLLAAHVDSTIQGLGPFAELLSVRPGARVQVTSQHLTQAFRVRTLRLVPQDGLADHRWIFSSRGPRRLVLVTCAPPYDRSHGGYQNLAVVVAVPLDAPTRRSGPMTRAARLPVAALVVLSAVTALAFWVANGWHDDAGVDRRAASGAAARPASNEPDDRMLIRVRVLPHGDLLVRHWIHSSRHLTSLVVATPVDPNLSAGFITATGLRVTAGQVRVEGATRLVPRRPRTPSARPTPYACVTCCPGALERAAPGEARRWRA